MHDVEHAEAPRAPFSIKTEVFEGPLELLLDLIEKHKLLINDISLASVTDEFMQYVATMEENALRETTRFVQLAATLLLIKSKSLLPVFELTEEEEGNIEDLERRLKEYQLFRIAGKAIGDIFGLHMAYRRRYVPPSEPLFVTDAYTEKDMLLSAMHDVVLNLPKKVEKPKVAVRKVVSLEEMIDRLKTRIERQMSFRFKEFTGNAAERGTIIVGFLAVLEMVKQGGVMVRQANRYSDIEIERDGSGTPRYI